MKLKIELDKKRKLALYLGLLSGIIIIIYIGYYSIVLNDIPLFKTVLDVFIYLSTMICYYCFGFIDGVKAKIKEEVKQVE